MSQIDLNSIHYLDEPDKAYMLLPSNMMRIGHVAAKFGVPFGLAFRRLVEVGRIKVADNAIEWVEGDL